MGKFASVEQRIEKRENSLGKEIILSSQTSFIVSVILQLLDPK